MSLRSLLFALPVLPMLFASPARAEELVTVQSAEGANVKFILIKPDNPKASVVLFAGGGGDLKLSSSGSGPVNVDKSMASNFLVRTRDRFAAHGFMVAVVDSTVGKMNATYRMDARHAGEIKAVADYLKQQAAVPVWLIGTSLGTFSAPNGALALKGSVDGLVLTSSITKSSADWDIRSSHPDGIINMPLADITVPVLITAHRNDGCAESNPANAEKLAAAFAQSPRVKTLVFSGGSSTPVDPCFAKTYHGYWGMEDEAVAAIAEFIKGK